MAGAAAKRQQRCTDGIAAFPDDVLLEVLSRVGNIKDLFRFAVTCRRWLRRFTDLAFLRRLCPGHGEDHRARLLGFFFQQTRFVLPHGGEVRKMLELRMAQHASVSAPKFLPAPGSPLGSFAGADAGHRALTSFVPDDDGTFNYAEPLATRRGIVLMRLVPRIFDLKRMTIPIHILGLCNPITGERHVLPPLDCSDDLGRYRYDSYAIITAADSDDLDGEPPPPPSGRFKFSQLLLITTQIKGRYMYLHSYSADTRSWSAPTMYLDGSRFSMVGDRSAAVHQGAVHWLCIDQPCTHRGADDYKLYKLSAKVGNATGNVRASLTNIPIRGGGSPLLCVGRDGKLSVACVHPLHLTVWTQQGGDEDDTPATWLRTSVIEEIPMAELKPSLCNPYGKCTWSDFNNGAMLVLPRSGGVFIFDLEKKVMKKVMDCLLPLFSSERSSVIHKSGTYLAYEVDLVEFFVLHLGGLCKLGSTE